MPKKKRRRSKKREIKMSGKQTKRKREGEERGRQ
jgi:hypothetical protein